MLKERLALTGLSDGKHLVHQWRDDAVAALPEVLRMAVGQVGIVPFDAERIKRPDILPEARSGRWGQGLTKAKMAECVC